MLAKAAILERNTGAPAVDIPARPRQLDPVLGAPRHPRQDPLRVDREEFDLTVAMIGLAAAEYRLTGDLAQCLFVETRFWLSGHQPGQSSSSVSISRKASSSLTRSN